jgi:5'-methylthioadenosine phosphorylase
MNPAIGILGGSGLYAMEGLAIRERRPVSTPWGAPSDPLAFGELNGVEVVFLARHGAGHRVTPSEVPYRANLWALKEAGVAMVLSVSAVGSLQPQHEPGTLRLPDQFIDRTVKRDATFFGNGLVAHVGFGDPLCPRLRAHLLAAGRDLSLPIEPCGTYVCMEGPAFSTRAESRMYRSWGADLIGMTNLTEAKLAREAELCYATIALVTDFDAWRETEGTVETHDVLTVMAANVAKAKDLLGAVVGRLGGERSCACGSALAQALMTAPEQVPDATRKTLGLLVAKYGY